MLIATELQRIIAEVEDLEANINPLLLGASKFVTPNDASIIPLQIFRVSHGFDVGILGMNMYGYIKIK